VDVIRQAGWECPFAESHLVDSEERRRDRGKRGIDDGGQEYELILHPWKREVERGRSITQTIRYHKRERFKFLGKRRTIPFVRGEAQGGNPQDFAAPGRRKKRKIVLNC